MQIMSTISGGRVMRMQCLNSLNFDSSILHQNLGNSLKRHFTSRDHHKIEIDNSKEKPVLIVSQYDSVDIIGPPDTVSNLRPVIRRNVTNGTSLQNKLSEMQNKTQEWNHIFWSKHNTRFIKERQKYIESYLKKTNEKQLTAEEMSEFYKQFLDENWQTHVKYNLEWYKRNFMMLLLALQVSIEKLARRML